VTQTTDTPPGNESDGLFLTLLETQNQKGKKLKNLAAEQRSPPQGCTIRPIKSTGQSLLGGI
jgi:hypothetical protein